MKKAFTLIELLVVVAILGIIAAIMVPPFLHMHRHHTTTIIRSY